MLTVQVNFGGTGWTDRNPAADTAAAEAVIAQMQQARRGARSFDFLAGFTGDAQVGALPAAEVRVVNETGAVVIEPRTLT